MDILSKEIRIIIASHTTSVSSGHICKGVSNPHTSNALSGCEKEE